MLPTTTSVRSSEDHGKLRVLQLSYANFYGLSLLMHSLDMVNHVGLSGITAGADGALVGLNALMNAHYMVFQPLIPGKRPPTC